MNKENLQRNLKALEVMMDAGWIASFVHDGKSGSITPTERGRAALYELNRLLDELGLGATIDPVDAVFLLNAVRRFKSE